PKPLQGITGLATVALAVGLAAWALTQWVQLSVVALTLAALGLLFGGVAVAALAKRRERGLGLPLAAVLVNLEAIVFAALAAGAQGPPDGDDLSGRPLHGNKAVLQLRKQLKDPDAKERLQAAFGVGELARELNKTVPELMALL